MIYIAASRCRVTPHSGIIFKCWKRRESRNQNISRWFIFTHRTNILDQKFINKKINQNHEHFSPIKLLFLSVIRLFIIPFNGVKITTKKKNKLCVRCGGNGKCQSNVYYAICKMKAKVCVQRKLWIVVNFSFRFTPFSGCILFNGFKNVNIRIDCDSSRFDCSLSCVRSTGKITF